MFNAKSGAGPDRRRPRLSCRLVLDRLTEEATNVGVFAAQEAVNVAGVDAEFLGLNGGHGGPVDDLCPLRIAIGNHGTKRLLGDDVRKHGDLNVKRGGERSQLGSVRGPNFALLGHEGGLKFVVGFELQRR